jgi:hypothetical protein
MKKNKSEAIKGFKAVEYMRKVRRQINEETQGMGFEELKQYFEDKKKPVEQLTTDN